ncbi:imidazole glycerol phosphate synthase subunit HisH [Flavobacterium sp. ZT3R18]|uniref:imidazole glycerol phosphate synthase subunit HisH n=1 Tax=Flavobacterium sp. ZT3R18 TaxID=2594429 RepID=UPI001179FDA4|nr:imidazole glycerol phosphate synthase subunit HisH [Flavobacterium sp. ZT3R18]TRX34809.1 imidazole glycerol phosphate synthase subunit HisH [Flavobacterium sp. ZT3R18]
MENNIIIVDYGLGNLKSIQNMLKKIGYNAIITADKKEIEKASKLILPGVGSFDVAMNNIYSNNLQELLDKKVLVDKTPILGICLGMQIMCKSSEEGKTKGLNWIDAEVVKFKFADTKFKSPHMGWNVVKPIHRNSLFKDIDFEEIKYYHVHSYYVNLNDMNDELCSTNYENNFTSGFQKGNIYGVQFHPEKSHKYGFELLKNFASI